MAILQKDYRRAKAKRAVMLACAIREIMREEWPLLAEASDEPLTSR
jgi:hypothetical protein